MCFNQGIRLRIPIVAKSDGTVVDGHLRLKAARKLGMESIPVVLSDNLNEPQTKAFRLLANQSANWAKWDDDLLRVEIQELEDLQFDLKMTEFELEKVQNFLDDLDREEEDFSDLIDDEKRVEITKPGDLWILGDHRIYCGDSSVVALIAAIIMSNLIQKYIEEALEKKMFIELESEKTSSLNLSDVEISSNDGEELAI